MPRMTRIYAIRVVDVSPVPGLERRFAATAAAFRGGAGCTRYRPDSYESGGGIVSPHTLFHVLRSMIP
jgi:hypothetical protein